MASPAELARQATRELSAEHARVVADLIADETRGHAARTVDPRWAAQVAALDVHPPADGGFMDAWRRANLAGLRGAVANAVEALRRAAAPARPGTAAPAAGDSAAGRAGPAGNARPADARVLSRIRALLAKAEATEFSEEAEALTGRAQELMAKYRIDHALLAAESGRKEEGGRAPDRRRQSLRGAQGDAAADGGRGEPLPNRVAAGDAALVTVIGFPADLDAVELLFTSLLVQANAAMVRACGKKDSYGRSRNCGLPAVVPALLCDAHRGAAGRSGRPRRAGGRCAEQAAGPGAARPAARTWSRSSRPGTGRSTTQWTRCSARTLSWSRAMRIDDADGWHSGRAAADQARLRGRTSAE